MRSCLMFYVIILRKKCMSATNTKLQPLDDAVVPVHARV
jgi:hypothetical protein